MDSRSHQNLFVAKYVTAFFLLFTLSILFTISNCQRDKGNISVEVTNTVTPLPKKTTTIAMSPTNTDMTAQWTPQPTPLRRFEIPSDSWKEAPELVSRCTVEIEEGQLSLPKDNILIGYIEDGGDYQFWQITANFQWEMMPNTQNAWPVDFSPDARKLALIIQKKDPANHLLRALDVNGLFVDVEIEGGFNWLSRWLNNDYLIIYTNANDHTKPKYLLDPFSGQTQPFPAYPDEKIDVRFIDVYWFNPQGSLVVYLETDYEEFRTYYSSEHHVIYDVEEKVKIDTSLSWAMSRPAWAPTGDYLAVVSQGRTHVMQQIPSKEVFLVDAFNGQSQQISNFFELFEGVNIQKLTWSPDGRYLLFELDLIDDALPEEYEPSLYLFDLQEQQVIDFCFEVVSSGYYHWSPNGQMVVWYGRDGDLYLLDVPTGHLIRQSPPKVGLVGWFYSGDEDGH